MFERTIISLLCSLQQSGKVCILVLGAGYLIFLILLQEMSTVLRRAVDPEEELRIMAQEVRDYVEAVLNSLSANIPKVSILIHLNFCS
jgi:hypothetical protein